MKKVMHRNILYFSVENKLDAVFSINQQYNSLSIYSPSVTCKFRNKLKEKQLCKNGVVYDYPKYE